MDNIYTRILIKKSYDLLQEIITCETRILKLESSLLFHKIVIFVLCAYILYRYNVWNKKELVYIDRIRGDVGKIKWERRKRVNNNRRECRIEMENVRKKNNIGYNKILGKDTGIEDKMRTLFPYRSDENKWGYSVCNYNI